MSRHDTISSKILKQVLVFTLLFIPVLLRAQFSIGLEAGATTNYVITNTSSLPFTVAEPVTGYTIGIPVEYKVNSWFSVMADPNLMKKDYKYVRTDFFQGVYETHHNTYLQLPVMGHFTFGPERLKGFLNIGGYAGYWTGGNVSGSEPNILNPVDDAFFTSNPSTVFGENNSYSFSEKYAFNTTRDNRWEIGWVVGLGVSYQITGRYKIFIEGRQTQALTDQQKNYMIHQIPRYNQTYGLTVGCLISLRKLESSTETNTLN